MGNRDRRRHLGRRGTPRDAPRLLRPPLPRAVSPRGGRDRPLRRDRELAERRRSPLEPPAARPGRREPRVRRRGESRRRGRRFALPRRLPRSSAVGERRSSRPRSRKPSSSPKSPPRPWPRRAGGSPSFRTAGPRAAGVPRAPPAARALALAAADRSRRPAGSFASRRSATVSSCRRRRATWARNWRCSTVADAGEAKARTIRMPAGPNRRRPTRWHRARRRSGRGRRPVVGQGHAPNEVEPAPLPVADSLERRVGGVR